MFDAPDFFMLDTANITYMIPSLIFCPAKDFTRNTLCPLTESCTCILISPSLKWLDSSRPIEMSRWEVIYRQRSSALSEKIFRSVYSHWSGEKKIFDMVAYTSCCRSSSF